MSTSVLIGQGNEIIKIPQEDWEKSLPDVKHHLEGRLSFMSGDHHLIRNFVVRELPEAGEALSPEFIAQNLKMQVSRLGEPG
jgi:hypothetical protein